MASFRARAALVAALTALIVCSPAAALAQPGHRAPAAPGRAALSAWARLHGLRGLPGPAPAGLPGSGRAAGLAIGGAPAPVTPGGPVRPTSYQGALEGVVAVSPALAFAVGYRCLPGCQAEPSPPVLDSLILQWNGTSWSQDASPSPSSSLTQLYGVTARSATDAWAVGSYCTAGCDGPLTSEVTRSLVLHWNGSAWSQVTSADPGAGQNILAAVTADSPTDAWAVGMTCAAGCGKQLTLIEHWNGSTWSQVTSPSPDKSYNFLNGVTSVSPSLAWAVGPAGDSAALTLKWNGKAWSRVTTPSTGKGYETPFAVSAQSGGNAWTVGTYCTTCNQPTGQRPHTLTLHWNGKDWSKTASPDLFTGDNELFGVAARSASDVWAAGESCSSSCTGSPTPTGYYILILHWNGRSWSVITTPRVNNGGFNALAGVSADSASDAWAVGEVCTANCGAVTEVDDTLILHWNGAAWSVSRAYG